MSAKEMFEKLGFEQERCDNLYITYVIYDNKNDYSICFRLSNKDIDIVNNTFNREYEYLKMPILKAINKQVEELGWNDRF